MAQDEAVRSGYLSEEDKRRFTLLAGVLGGVFFILQFLLPMAVMFAVMPAMMLDWSVVRFEVSDAVVYHDEVHLVEETMSVGGPGHRSSDNRLVRLGQEAIVEVAPLEGWTPRLLADADRLWLVSSDRMAVVEGGVVRPLPVSAPLGDTCRPFLLDGAPAVLERRPDGVRLLRWEQNAWQVRRPLKDVRDICSIQGLDTDSGLLLLREDGETLYSARPEADEPEWIVVLSDPDRWRLLELDGRPAVVSLGHRGDLRIVHLEEGLWTQAARAQVGGAELAGQIAAFQASAGEPLTLVSQGFPGSLKVRSWDGQRLADGERLGNGTLFPRGMLLMMTMPHLGTALLSLVLAVILAALMRTHRLDTHEHRGRVVAHASLTRRALAQMADTALLGLPAAMLVWGMFSDFEQIVDAGPLFPLAMFVKIGTAMAWGVLALAALAVTEGLWGWTPGKLLTGIRVVGTDLQPCGVGRAIIRNLLKVVDGFFNFLVGILMVALTPDWQRLGDMAARTIVIRSGAHSP